MAIATTGALLVTGPSAFADTLSDLKNQQQQLEKKQETLNSNIQETEGKINLNSSKVDQIMAQIKMLDTKILDTEAKVAEVLSQIELTTTEIEKLRASIDALIIKIEERDALLKERIRAVQVSGGSVSYIDVLLGANSFVDFIDRFSAVNTLMEADRSILEEQANDKLALEEQRASVEKKLKEQEARKAQLVELKASLDAQKNSKNTLIDQLEVEQSKLNEQKEGLEDHLDEVLNVSQDVQNKITAEQVRIAEIARKAAEEKKRQEAAERQRQADAESQRQAAAKSQSQSQSQSQSKVKVKAKVSNRQVSLILIQQPQ